MSRPPLESLGEFWKGKIMKKGRKRKKGRERETEEEREERQKGKWRGKKRRGGKIVQENLKWKGEKVWTEDFFFFFLLVTSWNHWNLFGVNQNGNFWGNFLSSPTFDCTPGYAPAFVFLFQTLFSTWSVVYKGS